MSQLRAHNKPPTTPMTFSVLVTLICVLLLYYIDANQTNPVIKTGSLYSHIEMLARLFPSDSNEGQNLAIR
jgi:hypothetical protein